MTFLNFCLYVLCSFMRWPVRWPQERTQGWHKKTKFIILSHPRNRVISHQEGPHRVVRVGMENAKGTLASASIDSQGGFLQKRNKGLSIAYLNIIQSWTGSGRKGNVRWGGAILITMVHQVTWAGCTHTIWEDVEVKENIWSFKSLYYTITLLKIRKECYLYVWHNVSRVPKTSFGSFVHWKDL